MKRKTGERGQGRGICIYAGKTIALLFCELHVAVFPLRKRKVPRHICDLGSGSVGVAKAFMHTSADFQTWPEANLC